MLFSTPWHPVQAMYAIVEFVGENSTAIIAQRWFVDAEETSCFWPPRKADEQARNLAPASPSWNKHDVRVLGKAATYERAREKLTRADETSDLQTEDEETARKRRRVRHRAVSSSSESGEEEEVMMRAPTPPPAMRCTKSATARPTVQPKPSGSSSAPSTSNGSDCRPSTNGQSGEDQSSVRGLFEHLITMLEDYKERQNEIRETQQVHGALLHSILRRLNGGGSVPATAGRLPSGAAGLPLTSMDEFRSLEERLGADEEFVQAMVLYLGDKGGSTVGECVRRVMAQLMRSGLGQRFNMNGAQRHGKTGFRATKLYTVVYRAVKQNPALSVTEKEIANAIGKWLVNSRDREGYRTARQATNSSGGGSGGADTSNGGGGANGVEQNDVADEGGAV
ncbi:uncharacterized protein LOC122391391 isoform X3 [Amphibalanus amphitrite]|uniref:uncharacterized protein LOC122376307 isoform X1 n=1 Tax=Amphibalanus amphitrite TaxID=1232801 RepID=UPI001C914384|nr:uncharacterized protein LOC122376307 isoform X1 [Amphibalanus amphitrite]XP_043241160.1 uncharacterized protein LOC122391391 isoform X3 [Amphibalanus amphitrite]